MFRVLDALEDARWEHPQTQIQSIDTFLDLLNKSPSVQHIDNFDLFTGIDLTSLSDGEQALIQDFRWLWQLWLEHIQRFPKSTHISNALNNMGRGMKYFLANQTFDTLAQTNSYCFFVTGVTDVIGEMLSELVSEHRPDYSPTQETFVKAYHFGLFLQKINIYKDRFDDDHEDRIFCKDFLALENSLAEQIKPAFEYVLELPQSCRDYRIFCAWSLFLGLASLPYIRKKNTDPKSKLPRSEALLLIHKIKGLNTEGLEKLFVKMCAQIGINTKTITHLESHDTPNPKLISEVVELYKGQLTSAQIQTLIGDGYR